MSSIRLSKENFTAINMFTADMDKAIDDIANILKDAFIDCRNGDCGDVIKDISIQLFNEWLIRSLLPRVTETTNFIIGVLKKTDDIESIKKTLKKKLPSFKDVESFAVEIMAEIKKGEALSGVVRKHIWDIYANHVDAFLIQTGHLMVGRLLMHFVGADKGAWKPLAVQSNASNPYLGFYWVSRSTMSSFLPMIYLLNELDWLYISDTMRQGLSSREAKVLQQNESRLDKALSRVYATLRKYNYQQVDMDLWKAVYQRFLPPEEVNRLGFVTTPDEIVDLILDLANYKSDVENLCEKTLLDPACGSGTFLVEALGRLRKHFEMNKVCHQRKHRQPSWEWEKAVLERMIFNIQGIDIHPFATFLTTINLTFQVIDIYSQVKHKYPEFSLSFNIVTHDALAEKPSVKEALPRVNSRVKEAIERSKRYAELCERRFDFVVGNPPWGTVLKGAIGPLGDEAHREDYKRRFESSTGKFDIFVLFMERGIRWLENRGILGMITQVAYVSQDFGKGIQKIIKRETAMRCFIDLSRLGHVIFPRWTNYPAITILEKGAKQKEVVLVEVREK